MKLNKTLGRVATTLVAGAMLTALAMPAYAANYDGSTGIVFNKTIDMTNATGATVPNATYSYKIEPGTYIAAQDGKPEIKVGLDGATITQNVAFTSSTTISENKAMAPIKVDLSAVNFVDPGIYRYKITETDPSVVGLATSTEDDVIYLDVYVVNSGDSVTVQSYQLTNNSAAPTVSGTEANYGEAKFETDVDEYTTYTLTVTKAVSGDMADKDRDYSFTIDLSSISNGTKVSVDGSQTADEATNNKLSISKSLNPKSENTDHVVITGVPGDAAYSIAENLNASEGFTVKVGDTTLTNVDGKYTTNDAMDSANASVTVTNIKNSVTPTGIVMNVAPYVLLVVVAAAGCFVFLRKRRED